MVNRFVAKYLLLGLVAVGLFATSCVHEKNEYAPESSIIIGYDVKLNNVSDKPATKADDGGMVVGEKIEIERLSEKFGEKNLFLHTITNVWDGSATGGAANGVANGAGYGSDVLTRGAFIKNGQEEGCYSITDKQIAVSAWVYDGDVSGGYTSGQQYFVNDLLESPWSSTRYWPELNDHLRFYAYAPTDVQSGEKNNGAANYVTLPSAWGNACVPSFDFVVPANVEEQSDLLVASAHVKKEVFGSDVNLKFYHALTAVQFMVEDLNGLLIKRVTLSGVKNEETYTYAHNLNGNAASTDAAYDLENGSWSSADATADGEYVLDFTSGELEKADGIESNDGYKFVTGDETPTVYTLNEGNFILFLMPQQLGDDAQITLEGYDEIRGENVTLSGKIGGSGKEWKKGQHIIYKISTSDISVQYVFEVEEVSIDMFQNDIVKEPLPTVEINGQNIVKYVPFYGQLGRKFDVKSYKKTTRLGESEPEITPLVWKIETEIPYWIDRISATSGTGLNNEAGVEEVTYDVIAQTPNCISHNNLNRGFPYNNETVATAYDLSTKGGVAAMNTANCYIVDAPGYYKLPLVYGNAIKDGSYNTVSYIAANPLTEPSSSSYLLPDNTSVTAYYDIMGQFYNYAGDGGWTPGTINDPWININDDILNPWIKVSDLDAEVVWQDQPCVITEAKIEGDYLYFRVREDCISECNAVVALKAGKGTDYGAGTIFWSWHIWVTDKDLTDNRGNFTIINNLDYVDDDTESFTNSTFELMRVPLGYCNAESKEYEPRMLPLTFCQYDNEVKIRSKTFTITQVGEYSYYDDQPENVVYYQYGRKDPLVSGWVKYTPAYEIANKPYYTPKRLRYIMGYGGGRVGFKHIDDGVYMAVNNAISLAGQMFMSPQFYLDADEWGSSILRMSLWYGYGHPNANSSTTGEKSDKIYVNLWNNNNYIMPMFSYAGGSTSEDVYTKLSGMNYLGMAKTVYDPSPAGYEVPTIDAYAGLTYGGLNYGQNIEILHNTHPVEGATNPEVKLISAPNNFYALEFCDYVTGEKISIGAFGYRSEHTGSVNEYGTYGGALTANPICVQWSNDNAANSYFEPYFLIGSARLFFAAPNNVSNYPTLWPIGSSSMAHGFPVIPAVTGSNPK